MTFFLALKSKEASSTVTNPELCGLGRKSVLQRREAPEKRRECCRPVLMAACVESLPFQSSG